MESKWWGIQEENQYPENLIIHALRSKYDQNQELQDHWLKNFPEIQKLVHDKFIFCSQ